MASLSLQVALKLVGSLTNALDLSTPVDPISKDYTFNVGNGTGAGQGNMIWHDQRSVDTNGEDLDLAAGLTSTLGGTITFTAVKGILVYAAAANVGNVIISRPASNGLVLFAAAQDALAALKPGGIFLFTDPSAAGLTVTANTGDLLNFDSSSGTVTYDVWIWGEV